MKRASPGEAEIDEGLWDAPGKARRECPGSRVPQAAPHPPSLVPGGRRRWQRSERRFGQVGEEGVRSPRNRFAALTRGALSIQKGQIA